MNLNRRDKILCWITLNFELTQIRSMSHGAQSQRNTECKSGFHEDTGHF